MLPHDTTECAQINSDRTPQSRRRWCEPLHFFVDLFFLYRDLRLWSGVFVAFQTGYLVGSVEGRVAVQHVDESMHAKNFTFKCHREDNDIYAVLGPAV